MDRWFKHTPLMSSSLWNQARALGESTSHSRTLHRVIPILHQESWIMCFYLFVWYGSWKGLHTVITEPTWQWLCWLNASKGNHRKQFNWNSTGVCSLLLVRLCGKFLSAQCETTDCCLRLSWNHQGKQIFGVIVGFFVLFLLLFDLASGWLFFTQQSWGN